MVHLPILLLQTKSKCFENENKICLRQKSQVSKTQSPVEFMPVYASRWHKLVYASQFLTRLKPVNTTCWHKLANPEFELEYFWKRLHDRDGHNVTDITSVFSVQISCYLKLYLRNYWADRIQIWHAAKHYTSAYDARGKIWMLLHVRTCAPLICISETTGQIELKFGKWAGMSLRIMDTKFELDRPSGFGDTAKGCARAHVQQHPWF